MRPNSKNDAVITAAERSRRVLAVAGLPHRHHRSGAGKRHRRGSCCSAATSPGCPGRCPATCPSTPTGGSPRRCANRPYELAACALRLQRSCGLRIGELLDLELDCVHEVPGQGAWLKVPLGKLDTERMVPLDDDTLGADRPASPRSAPRAAPCPHPRYRPPGPVPVHPPRTAAVPERRPRRARPGRRKPPGSAT